MGEYRLSGAVMSHPRRVEQAAALVSRLGADRTDLVTDPEPDGPRSALRTTMRAWSSAPDGSTHRVVLHDDMVPVAGFWARAEAAVSTHPRGALALSAFWNSRNGAAVRLAVLGGHRWVRAVNEYTPCIALVLPVDVGAAYAAFAAEAGDGWPEDVLMYRFLKDAGVATYLAAPSLAEHQDLRSLSGNDFHGVRRSACFVADEEAAANARRGVGESVEYGVVPFFKYGRAMCAVRRGAAWDTTPTEQFLIAAGHHIDEIEASCDAVVAARERRHEAGAVAARGTWLTAYAMGVVLGARGGVAAAEEGVRRALATIAPGGLCDRVAPAVVDELEAGFADVATEGLEAGLRASWRGTAPSRRPARRVVVVGASGFPREPVARAFAQRGYHVTTAASGPREDVGDRAVLVDVSEPVTVVCACSQTGRHMPVGDLYGPDMPLDHPLARFVVSALTNRPIVVGPDPERVLWLLHTDELVERLDAALGSCQHEPGDGVAGTPTTTADLARLVSGSVRPVPVIDSSGTATTATPAVDLRERVRWLAQWIAYESAVSPRVADVPWRPGCPTP
jgi:hypothetical protein